MNKHPADCEEYLHHHHNQLLPPTNKWNSLSVIIHIVFEEVLRRLSFHCDGHITRIGGDAAA